MPAKWLNGISLILALAVSLEAAQVTKDELNNLGNALWRADRRISNVQFHVQGKLANNQSRSDKDAAPQRLFAMSPDVFNDRETISKFVKLFDNYEHNVAKAEDYTPEEDAEVNDFLNSVLDTGVMKVAWDFLVKKELASPDRADFFAQLKDLWFTPFKRGGKTNSSSGFEHVFMGEIKKKSTTGFHNWIQFFSEERAGRINYAGYYDLENYGSGSALTVKFFWDQHLKPKSTIFIRTTPEFELALYTSCFLINPNRVCKTQVNGTPIRIQTVEKKLGEKLVVNTAYANTL